MNIEIDLPTEILLLISEFLVEDEVGDDSATEVNADDGQTIVIEGGQVVNHEGNGPIHEVPLGSFAALALTSRRFYSMLNGTLYQLDAKHNRSKAMVWGAIKNMVTTMERSRHGGGDINAS